MSTESSETPKPANVQGLLALVAYGPSCEYLPFCTFCYTRHQSQFNRFTYNSDIRYHWELFLRSPLEGKGGRKWLHEMETNVHNKREELKQDIVDAEEALRKFTRGGWISVFNRLFERRHVDWLESSVRGKKFQLESHDITDVIRNELYSKASTYTCYLEDVLAMRKTMTGLLFCKNNLTKRLPADVRHHYLAPKPDTALCPPVLGKDYITLPINKIHSEILAAFTCKESFMLSPEVERDYRDLLDETINSYRNR